MLAAITVCNKDGIILDMNDRALEFNDRSREDLIGANIVDCHPAPIKQQAKQLLTAGKIHTYIFDKSGKTYISYYNPWIVDGQYQGIVEFILEIPPDEIADFCQQAQSIIQ